VPQPDSPAPTNELVNSAPLPPAREPQAGRGARSPHLWNPPQDDEPCRGCALCHPTNGWPPKWPTAFRLGPYLPYAHAHAAREAWQHNDNPQNYGCTHFIIWPRHGRLQIIASGDDFYGPTRPGLCRDNAQRTGAWKRSLPSNLVYTEERAYVTRRACRSTWAACQETERQPSSGKMLRAGEEIPECSPSAAWWRFVCVEAN